MASVKVYFLTYRIESEVASPLKVSGHFKPVFILMPLEYLEFLAFSIFSI